VGLNFIIEEIQTSQLISQATRMRQITKGLFLREQREGGSEGILLITERNGAIVAPVGNKGE